MQKLTPKLKTQKQEEREKYSSKTCLTFNNFKKF